MSYTNFDPIQSIVHNIVNLSNQGEVSVLYAIRMSEKLLRPKQLAEVRQRVIYQLCHQGEDSTHDFTKTRCH